MGIEKDPLRNIRNPNLLQTNIVEASQQIRMNLLLRMLFACIGAMRAA